MTNRIRELRKENNITMKQLGEHLGLGESTISQYETGKREPDLKTLLKISEYFHVSVDYLLGHVSEPWFYLDNERILRELNDSGDETHQDTQDTIKQRILSAFDQLNDEGQGKAVERVEELTEIPKYQKENK